MKYTHIVWDFNGTLMDDVDIAVASVNDMLKKRDMPKTDKNTYLTQITSPIIEYYRKIFDLEKVPFEVITEEFLEGYMKRLGLAHLTKGAHDALDMFCSLGIKQCVISSFEQGRLEGLIEKMGISRYFDFVSGADNIRAEGKEQRGLGWLEKSGADPEKVLVIGDLLHDSELAFIMGADCVLIASGHQGKPELLTSGRRVYDDLEQMLEDLKHD